MPHNPEERRAEAGCTRPRRTLGLLVDWLRDLYQNSVLTAIAQAAREFDVNLLCVTGGILESPDAFWSQRNLLYELVGSKSVDGLIITAGTMGNLIGPERLARFLERYRSLPLISTAYQLPDYPSVIVDNMAGMRTVVEHIVDYHGCRRVAFIRGPRGNEEAETRFSVYCRVLEERGIASDPALVFEGDFSRESGTLAGNVLAESGLRPQALIAANDLMALGAMDSLKAHGVTIPEALRIAGFDDIEESRFAMPQLTTVRQPFRSMGERAVQMGIAQLNGEPVPHLVTLQPELVVRRSCGCVLDAGDEELSVLGSIGPTSPDSDIRMRFLASFQMLRDQGVVLEDSCLIELFEAFMTELKTDVTGVFAQTLANLVRSSGNDDLSPWHAVMRVLYKTIWAWTAVDALRRARAQRIRAQVRLLIGDMAELVQGQQRIRLGELAVALGETSKALTATFDLETMRDVLKRLLPRLEIEGHILALYDDRSQPQATVTIQSAYHVSKPAFAATLSAKYDSSALIPPQLLQQDSRVTLVVEPLYFDRQQFGFVAFEMGPREGLIYEALRDQISGALEGGTLMSRIVKEARLRQLAEKEQAEKELKIASHIQSMILPKHPEAKGLEMSAAMLPAINVGGDYFDIIPVTGGCWIGIGDVVGHGLGSGLIMMMVQSMVAALIRQKPDATPCEIVCSLNSVLHENLRNRMGQDEHATFCLLRVADDGRVTYAGAHEEILIYRAQSGSVERIVTDGVWLAIIPDIAPLTSDSEIRLNHDDVILLYTDGVVEARDVRDTMFGIERLSQELQAAGHLPVQQICDRILQCVQEFMSIQHDDIALVVARRLPEDATNDASPKSPTP